jgi:chromosomal replication initiator protein
MEKGLIMSMATTLIDDKLHNNETWSLVQTRLRSDYGDATFRSWLSKLNFISSNNGHVLLSAPTRFIKEWILTHYASPIRNIWRAIDTSVIAVDIIVGATKIEPITVTQEIENRLQQNAAPSVQPNFLNQFKPEPTEFYINSSANNNDEIFGLNLDKRYNFDNFVVGPSNQLAHAAARSVAESNKAQIELNPLFLYGGVGLGKTHLMHSIAWHIKNTSPSRKVVYMSAEKFMYQFVRALRNKDIMSFKEQFRSVDVLMIDDVQFICGKDSTQEEFFHTFNALIDNNRQMVISCDRSPSDLDGMEERIKSRLGWGLVVDVHSTTYELRLGILQSKLEQMRVEVPLDVIEFLAAKITSNVRELEGALNKVVAHSTLMGRKITLDSTQEILQDLLRSNEKIVTIEEIQKRVAERYNIRVSDMSSARRLRTVARPRQVAMYLSKILTPRSLVEIGRKFGGKDHTTVMHAVKKVEELSKEDGEFNDDIKLLIRMLQS